MLEEKLKTLADVSGVYLMKDSHGRVIYVGKATSLRHRVRSYFQGPKDSPRLSWLVRQIRDFDVIATDSEMEALILEDSLIKKHHPYFNVRLRDDKRYPLLEITAGETWPRLRVARRAINRRSRYFGPYTSSQAMRQTIKLLRKVFKLRTCTLPMEKPIDRPCLDFFIAQCSAPCTRQISEEEYRSNVDAACRFLEGHAGELVRSLKTEMGREAEALNYERAGRLRNIIQALEKVLERQKMVSERDVDEDYVAVALDETTACAQVLMVREGKLTEEQHFLLEAQGAEGEGEVMSAFVRQYYGPGKFVPRQILTAVALPDADVVSAWLTEVAGRRITLKVPERGEKRELAQLAAKNARVHLEAAGAVAHRVHAVGIETLDETLQHLQQALELPAMPWRI
ncbi:MAG: excinuclease ABC subunit UvrC, partial [Candidatus Xenobia bacterium]